MTATQKMTDAELLDASARTLVGKLKSSEPYYVVEIMPSPKIGFVVTLYRWSVAHEVKYLAGTITVPHDQWRKALEAALTPGA